MTIQLGNLELKDVVEEKYLAKIQEFLDINGYKRECKCDDICKKEGNYHIFDIPRLIIICGENKMKDFITFLQTNKLVNEAFIGQVGLTFTEYKPVDRRKAYE